MDVVTYNLFIDIFMLSIFFYQQKTVETDETPHSAASDLGLHSLSMSHKKDTMLNWVNASKTSCKGKPNVKTNPSIRIKIEYN